MVYQASTFAGNPISVCAALASVKTMNRLQTKLYPKLEKYSTILSDGIRDIATDYGIAHSVNSFSSMLQIFFSAKPVTNYDTCMNADAKKFQKLFSGLIRNGVFIAPSQFEVVFLSNAIQRDDLGIILDSYSAALREVKD